MPTIKNIDGTRIMIFTNDHPSPHVHLLNADFELKVEIETGKILMGNQTRKAKKALNLITENRAILLEILRNIHG